MKSESGGGGCPDTVLEAKHCHLGAAPSPAGQEMPVTVRFLSRSLEGTMSPEPGSSKSRHTRGQLLTLLCPLCKGSLRPARQPAVLQWNEEQPWGPGGETHTCPGLPPPARDCSPPPASTFSDDPSQVPFPNTTVFSLEKPNLKSGSSSVLRIEVTGSHLQREMQLHAAVRLEILFLSKEVGQEPEPG